MKDRPSKLDAYAARLDEWFSPIEEGGKGLTLDQAREQLKLDGVSVSCSSLSVWWADRRQQKLQTQLLGQIASGARAVAEVQAALGSNPAPEMDTLIKLHRVLILKLSTQGNADPELLELVNRMMKPVVQFERLKQLQAQLNLDERKLELMEKKARQADEAKGVVESALTPEEKTQRMKEIFGIAS